MSCNQNESEEESTLPSRGSNPGVAQAYTPALKVWWWELVIEVFCLCFPHFLSCRHYVALIIKPTAQGATVPRLSGVCLPPACLTSARAAPMGHDQNMSSLHWVFLGGQPGPAWSCVLLSRERPEILDCLL